MTGNQPSVVHMCNHLTPPGNDDPMQTHPIDMIGSQYVVHIRNHLTPPGNE
jgi:hypothetical protein